MQASEAWTLPLLHGLREVRQDLTLPENRRERVFGQMQENYEWPLQANNVQGRWREDVPGLWSQLEDTAQL